MEILKDIRDLKSEGSTQSYILSRSAPVEGINNTYFENIFVCVLLFSFFRIYKPL